MECSLPTCRIVGFVLLTSVRGPFLDHHWPSLPCFLDCPRGGKNTPICYSSFILLALLQADLGAKHYWSCSICTIILSHSIPFHSCCYYHNSFGFSKNRHVVCRSDSFSTALIAAIVNPGYVGTCTRT